MSVLTSLFPVILMAITTIYTMVVHGGIMPKNLSVMDNIVAFIGSPGIAMLISLLFAYWSMGVSRKIPNKQIAKTIEDSVKSIAMLLLVIGGGGAFKQVLIDGGVGDAVKNVFMGVNISPLILGWLIAVILRIALGSATVAA